MKKTGTDVQPAAPERRPSKLSVLQALLEAPDGATLDDLGAATGWQAHSVRGALSGALRKKGCVVVSAIADGARRYRIVKNG